MKYSVIVCTLADFQVFFDQGMKLICGSGSELVLGSKFEDVVEASVLWGQILYGTSLCSGVEGQLDFRRGTEMRGPAMACRQKSH